jgi:hypothetical protein
MMTPSWVLPKFRVVCVCVKREQKCMYLLLMCVYHSSLVFNEPLNNRVFNWLGLDTHLFELFPPTHYYQGKGG